MASSIDDNNFLQLQNQIDNLKDSINKDRPKKRGIIPQLNEIPQGPGSGLNADNVDGINASYKPQPNTLVPLGSNGKFPTSTIPTAGGGSGFLLGNGVPTDKNILVADGTLWQSRTMSGDATISVDTGTLTLSNTAVTAGAYGDSSHYTTFTVDAKGRLTAAASVSIPASNNPGGTSGAIQFNESNVFTGNNAHLFWDNTNFRLGIGTSSPSRDIEINGSDAVIYNKATGGASSNHSVWILESTASGSFAEVRLVNNGTPFWSFGLDSGDSNTFKIGNGLNVTANTRFRLTAGGLLELSGYSTGIAQFNSSGDLSSSTTIQSGTTWNGNKIGLAFGGTNADLSSTGGGSNVLQQSSSGAAITVGQLASTDLSNGTSLNLKANTIAHYCGYFRTETGLTLPTTFLTTTNDAAITIKRITVDPVVPSIGSGTGTVFRFTDGTTNCDVTLGPGAGNATATFTQNYPSSSTLQMKVVSDDNATPPTDINMVVEYIIQ